jgi:hypothetical protein
MDKEEMLQKIKKYLYERLDRLNDDELYDIFSVIIDDMVEDFLAEK